MQAKQNQPNARALAKSGKPHQANIDKTGDLWDTSLKRIMLLLKELAEHPNNKHYTPMVHDTHAALKSLLEHTLPKLSHHNLPISIKNEFHTLHAEFKAKAVHAQLHLPQTTIDRITGPLRLNAEEVKVLSAHQAFKLLLANAMHATLNHAKEIRLDHQQQRQKRPIDIEKLNLKPVGGKKFKAQPKEFNDMYEEGGSQKFGLTDCGATLLISDTAVNMEKWNPSAVESYAKVVIEQANRQDWDPTFLSGSLQQLQAITAALRNHGMNKPVRITKATIQGFEGERLSYIHKSGYPFPLNILNGFSPFSFLGSVSLFDQTKKSIFLNMAIINNTPHAALGESFKNPVAMAAATIQNIHRKHGDRTFNTVTFDECAKSIIEQELPRDVKDNNELVNRYIELFDQLNDSPMKMDYPTYHKLIPPNYEAVFHNAIIQRNERFQQAPLEDAEQAQLQPAVINK